MKCSWQHRLILCLGLDHFTTKQTDTISGSWPFHDNTDWYCIWGLTISWQNRLILCLGFDVWSWNGQASDMVSVCFVMKWSNPRHNISLFCHEMVKPQIQYQCVLSWNGQDPDIVSVCFVTKWSNPRHNISLFCHEMVKPQIQYFRTKHTDTLSEAWPFHDKINWYYV
jgi:hypothetical protein